MARFSRTLSRSGDDLAAERLNEVGALSRELVDVAADLQQWIDSRDHSTRRLDAIAIRAKEIGGGHPHVRAPIPRLVEPDRDAAPAHEYRSAAAFQIAQELALTGVSRTQAHVQLRKILGPGDFDSALDAVYR